MVFALVVTTAASALCVLHWGALVLCQYCSLMVFDAVNSIVRWEMGWEGSRRGARTLLYELGWSEHITRSC